MAQGGFGFFGKGLAVCLAVAMWRLQLQCRLVLERPRLLHRATERPLHRLLAPSAAALTASALTCCALRRQCRAAGTRVVQCESEPPAPQRAAEVVPTALPGPLIWLPFWRSLAVPVSALAAAVTQLDWLLSAGPPQLPRGSRSVAGAGLLLSLVDTVVRASAGSSSVGRAVHVEEGTCVLGQASSASPPVNVRWTSASMRGWRPTMEDTHVAVSFRNVDSQDLAVFGVFDGHGGSDVSAMVQALLPQRLGSRLASWSGAGGSQNLKLGELLSEVVTELDATLLRGPLGVGRLLHKELLHPFSRMGCTSCIAALDHERREIVVANSGDSRAILCRKGKALALSEDHKPEDEAEFRRIARAGGRVVKAGPCYRIDGGLNLSRALGDFQYKANSLLPETEQRVVATPDVVSHSWDWEQDEFLILACDGLFERMSREGVVGFVHSRLRAGDSPEDVLRGLLDACCAKAPNEMGQDNETAVLVQWSVAK